MQPALRGATGRSSSGNATIANLIPSPHSQPFPPHPPSPSPLTAHLSSFTLTLTLTRHATNAPHIHGEDGGQPWTGKPELLEHFAHVCESGCDNVSSAAYDTRHYAAVVLAMDQAFEATNAALQRNGMLDDALQVPL